MQIKGTLWGSSPNSSSVLQGPLRDDTKRASELSHPKGKQAGGFILQLGHCWLKLAPGLTRWHSSPALHTGWGSPQSESCPCWQCEDWCELEARVPCYQLHLVWPGQQLWKLSLWQEEEVAPLSHLQWAEEPDMNSGGTMAEPRRESSGEGKSRACVGCPLETQWLGRTLERDWRAIILYCHPLLCLKAVVAWVLQVPKEF